MSSKEPISTHYDTPGETQSGNITTQTERMAALNTKLPNELSNIDGVTEVLIRVNGDYEDPRQAEFRDSVTPWTQTSNYSKFRVVFEDRNIDSIRSEIADVVSNTRICSLSDDTSLEQTGVRGNQVEFQVSTEHMV